MLWFFRIKAFFLSKTEFAAAIEVLEKAIALDASNTNATTLLDACKAVK